MAAVPLRFQLRQSADHVSPSVDPATVVLWSPGAAPAAAPWSTPAGALTADGEGWWTIAADDADQSGGYPLLLYATAGDADPTPAIFWGPGGPQWVAGSSSQPYMPIWLGTSASGGYLPAPGQALSISASAGGAAFAPAQGTPLEPGGVGAGRGFYLYPPVSAEVAAGGDTILYVVSTGTDGWSWDYPVTAASSPTPTPTPTPTPSPSPTPTPGAGAATAAVDGHERQIRAAIAENLRATGRFGEVRVGRMPEDLGSPASDLAMAVVGPASTRRLSGWDAAAWGGVEYDCTVRVTVLARSPDPELTDDEAEGLWEAVLAAVDGRPLVPGLTVPQRTYASGWQWQETPLPERRIQGTASVHYVIPWGGPSAAEVD